MSDFDDYAETTEKLLLLQLYEKIIFGDMKSFEDLKKAVSKYRITPGIRKCLFRAFALQRRLYWGFFQELTPKKYPQLWRELVISDQDFRFAGELKRSMSIPEIYLGLLDIHGYTRYCSDKKRNISMIDLLDRMIYEDVTAICLECGVISKRAQGDEILLIGAAAEGVLNAVLKIMDYFNTQGRSFRNTVLSKKLPGTVLPKFQVSAGIAGGQKFTPLIITRDGDISGDIVNTAARLQARANKISPDKNRIMITNHVHQKLKSEIGKNEELLNRISFFNAGVVEFKGVSLSVYDVIFLPEEAYRLELIAPMENLYESLVKKMWKTKILTESLNISARIIKTQIDTGCRDTAAGRKLKEECMDLLELNKSIRTMFNAMYYDAAIKTFTMLINRINAISSIDRIAAEYLNLIKENYKIINEEYTSILDEEVEERLNELYSLEEKDNYLLLKKHSEMFEKVQSSTKIKLKNKKKLWLRAADNTIENLSINLKSVK